MRLRGLFIGFRRVLETLVNLGNSEFHLLVKLGDNPITNRIRFRPELRFYLAGYFWHCGSPNWKNDISHWFVSCWVSFPMPLESPQSDIWARSYGQNTETCAESKFESNPIFYSNWWIPISSFPHLLGLPNLPFKLGTFPETLPFLLCPTKTQKTWKEKGKSLKWTDSSEKFLNLNVADKCQNIHILALNLHLLIS